MAGQIQPRDGCSLEHQADMRAARFEIHPLKAFHRQDAYLAGLRVLPGLAMQIPIPVCHQARGRRGAWTPLPSEFQKMELRDALPMGKRVNTHRIGADRAEPAHMASVE